MPRHVVEYAQSSKHAEIANVEPEIKLGPKSSKSISHCGLCSFAYSLLQIKCTVRGAEKLRRCVDLRGNHTLASDRHPGLGIFLYLRHGIDDWEIEPVTEHGSAIWIF